MRLMEKPQSLAWRPMTELPHGHYAIGRLVHGGETPIFNAGGIMFDVDSGHKVIVVGWKPRDVHAGTLPSFPLT